MVGPAEAQSHPLHNCEHADGTSCIIFFWMKAQHIPMYVLLVLGSCKNIF